MCHVPDEGLGIQPLPFVERGGVKEFRLSAEPVRWEYARGRTVEAWAYNGRVPGPEIRVSESDPVRIIFTNRLPTPTTIHWHGLHVPAAQDGMPGIGQRPIQPGETFTYEFVARPAGTRWYHAHGSAHGDEAAQLDMGLAGPFIVEAAGTRYDREYVLVLDDWMVLPDGRNGALAMAGHGAMAEHVMAHNLFTVNGRAFPDTQPLTVREPDRVLLRFIGASTSTVHPMHLHGHSFTIVAVDGNPVPQAARLVRDTLPVGPGERYDVELLADNPGAWLLHCHELHHADAGMAMLFLYEGYAPIERPGPSHEAHR